jgi:hypothetical protein
MAEKLLDGSGVRLFGQEVTGIQLAEDALMSDFGGIADRIKLPSDATPRFARIYGFSYEGQYFDLARPVIFLVWGDGSAADDSLPQSGFVPKPPHLAAGTMVWKVDGSDLTVRLDVEVGGFDRILLDAEIGPDQRVTMSGQNVRYAGQNIRYSGQNVRMSAAGQNVRLRYAGQNVRGGGD